MAAAATRINQLLAKSALAPWRIEALPLSAMEDMLQRAPYGERREPQAEALGLPLLPTTTIGSFPQTAELGRVRAAPQRCRRHVSREVCGA